MKMSQFLMVVKTVFIAFMQIIISYILLVIFGMKGDLVDMIWFDCESMIKNPNNIHSLYFPSATVDLQTEGSQLHISMSDLWPTKAPPPSDPSQSRAPLSPAAQSLSATMVCYDNKSVDFFYNHSTKYIGTTWKPKDFVVVSLGLLVCVFVIFANILVMMAIFMDRRFHYPIYYLLGNLAAADLFSGVSYMHLMFHTGPWTIKLTQYQWFVRQVRLWFGRVWDWCLMSGETMTGLAIETTQRFSCLTDRSSCVGGSVYNCWIFPTMCFMFPVRNSGRRHAILVFIKVLSISP